MENKEFLGIGRAYLLAFLGMFLSAVLAVVVIIKVPNTYTYVLGYWKELLVWMVPLVIAAKEGGKLGNGILSKVLKKE